MAVCCDLRSGAKVMVLVQPSKWIDSLEDVFEDEGAVAAEVSIGGYACVGLCYGLWGDKYG